MERLSEISAKKAALLAEVAELEKEEAHLRAQLRGDEADPSDAVIDMDTATPAEAIAGSMTQNGCAAAQEHFDNADAARRDALTAAAWAALPKLMCDAHGTYFAQKLIEVSDDAQILAAIAALGKGDDIVVVASNTHGSRAMQRLMEHLSNEARVAAFFNLVVPHVTELAIDANSTHVIQRILGQRSPASPESARVCDALVANCAALSMNKQGCCIIQRCYEVSEGDRREALVKVILDNTLSLVQNAFGNYVVGYLLDQKDDALVKRVILQLLHNVAALSCNKFGSNVVEKCMRLSRPEVKQLLIDELTDPSVLPRLVQDSYANYVMQTAISTADEDQFAQLHNAIRPCFQSLRNSPYGVRIEAKINRRLKDAARQRQRKNRAHQQNGRGGGGGGNQQMQHQQQSQQQQQQQGLPSPALQMQAAPMSFQMGAMPHNGAQLPQQLQNTMQQGAVQQVAYWPQGAFQIASQ